jgi:hypothetical protein
VGVSRGCIFGGVYGLYISGCHCVWNQPLVQALKRMPSPTFPCNVTPFFSSGWASIFRAHEDAEKKRRLRTLTNRINGRVMVLFMDRLSEIVEEKLRVLKASLVEKSDLLNR